VNARVRPARRLAGTVTVPGDKSVSHRAALLGAVVLAAIPLLGYVAVAAAPVAGARLQRRADARHAGLRVLAKD
jgi:hypothetical protein